MGKQHDQLTLHEREHISVLKASGKSLRDIGRLLGKHASTICRELQRNRSSILRRPVYFPAQAEIKAKKRKQTAAQRFRLKNQEIRDYVKEKLALHWTPEQVAGRISIDHPNLKISHEAIYQYIYLEAWDLFRFLPRKHKRRRLHFHYRKHQGVVIPERTFICNRPEEVNQRFEFGHWEADSIVSKANATALHVLHERKSRLVKITKIFRNSSPYVRGTIVRRLQSLPQNARRSITYDNGFENIQHREVNRDLKTRSYFCNPYHSWEKGAVENSNGLIRRFIPKRTDLQRVPSTDIGRIENLLNNRPRKCLNYQTPNEVFKNLSVAVAA